MASSGSSPPLEIDGIDGIDGKDTARDPARGDWADAPYDQGAIWAASLFGFVLMALGAGIPSTDPIQRDVRCETPREVQAVAGWTRVVSCEPLPGGGRPLRGPVRWLFGRRVSLDTADRRLLEALPGIGPARAEAIVAERRLRRFASVSELARVHGIGPVTVRRLQPFLMIDPAPADAASAGRVEPR